MNTTAEIFADYLGLTPEGAPWAWTEECGHCGRGQAPQFTATSPLAEKPTPGWLEVLVNYPSFYAIDRCDYNAFCASIGDDDNPDCPTKAEATHPTRAVALALLAADPILRARCEAASDASEVLP